MWPVKAVPLLSFTWLMCMWSDLHCFLYCPSIDHCLGGQFFSPLTPKRLSLPGPAGTVSPSEFLFPLGATWFPLPTSWDLCQDRDQLQAVLSSTPFLVASRASTSSRNGSTLVGGPLFEGQISFCPPCDKASSLFLLVFMLDLKWPGLSSPCPMHLVLLSPYGPDSTSHSKQELAILVPTALRVLSLS